MTGKEFKNQEGRPTCLAETTDQDRMKNIVYSQALGQSEGGQVAAIAPPTTYL